MSEMEKITISINKRLLNMVFEKVEKPLLEKESASGLIQMRISEGIKVKSVFALNENRKANEEDVLSWMRNKIQNVHLASYEKWLCYKEETDQRQNWTNCPIQNKRYIETKSLYKEPKTI